MLPALKETELFANETKLSSKATPWQGTGVQTKPHAVMNGKDKQKQADHSLHTSTPKSVLNGVTEMRRKPFDVHLYLL